MSGHSLDFSVSASLESECQVDKNLSIEYFPLIGQRMMSKKLACSHQLVRSFPEQNQRLLDTFSEFLLWSRTLEALPNKCWSVALKNCADCYHRFNPQLTISGELLNYLHDGDFRYLGRPTNVHGSELRSRAAIETK